LNPYQPFLSSYLETIEKDPGEYGYEFGRWTAARLATYLEKITGIKLSGSQITRILHKKNTFTFGRSTV
jgi:transposase